MTTSEKEQKEKSNKSAIANLSDSNFSLNESTERRESTTLHVDSLGICSSTDCTGLIPALPTSEAELEAYEEMYQFCLTDKTQDF